MRPAPLHAESEDMGLLDSITILLISDAFLVSKVNFVPFNFGASITNLEIPAGFLDGSTSRLAL